MERHTPAIQPYDHTHLAVTLARWGRTRIQSLRENGFKQSYYKVAFKVLY